MEGLGELVEEGKVGEMVAASDQASGVASQRGGVARDVDQQRSSEAENGVQCAAVETGARRINQDEIGVQVEGWEDLLDRGFVDLDMVEFIQVEGEIIDCAGGGFNRDQPSERWCQESAEKTDAAVQIEGEGIGLQQTAPFQDGKKVVNHGTGNGGIGLEKGAGGDLEPAIQHLHMDGRTAGEDKNAVRGEVDDGDWEVLDAQLG